MGTRKVSDCLQGPRGSQNDRRLRAVAREFFFRAGIQHWLGRSNHFEKVKSRACVPNVCEAPPTNQEAYKFSYTSAFRCSAPNVPKARLAAQLPVATRPRTDGRGAGMVRPQRGPEHFAQKATLSRCGKGTYSSLLAAAEKRGKRGLKMAVKCVHLGVCSVHTLNAKGKITPRYHTVA